MRAGKCCCCCNGDDDDEVMVVVVTTTMRTMMMMTIMINTIKFMLCTFTIGCSIFTVVKNIQHLTCPLLVSDFLVSLYLQPVLPLH